MTAVDALGQLGRPELAVVLRELLLAGQLMDRAGMPHVIGAYGRDEMGGIAIDEWMGASPIYTRRMQRLLGFEGDGVETLFKGLQIDIGAPPEFMDFRLRVDDHDHGEFWLDHCGALLDVEPMGEEFVHTMCHTIEDPTFDATAMATNPRARIRPIHRPPRTPADRQPHCHWSATIDPTVEPLPEPEPATHMATTGLAHLPVPRIDAGGGGRDDYRGPLDPDLRFEEFSRSALLGMIDEVCVQTHLLATSFQFAIERRHGAGDAVSIGRRQLTGIAGLTSERLREGLGLAPSLEAVARVLDLHPVLRPRAWVDATVDLDPETDRLEVRIRQSTATTEAHRNWIRLLVDGHDDALDALVAGVDPHLRCERLEAEAGDDEVAAWRVVRAAETAREPREVALTRFSIGATFRFSESPVELR